MRFGVLGPVAVWDADGRAVRVGEAKVRALLANLLVHRGGPVSVDRLIEDLWAGAPPDRPRNALQTKVSVLRRAVGRTGVVLESAGYRLAAADETVDAADFERLLDRARRAEDVGRRAALLGEAAALWRGEPYADVADAPFARPEITRLTELRLTMLEDLAEARLELGEHDVLVAELAETLARHPLRERLRTAQMLALYRAGRQNDAMAGYHELRRLLAEELGTTPAPRTVAIYEAMLRQEPRLAPPVTTPRASGRVTLPPPATPLIGRDAAVRTVRDRLSAASGPRIMTLTGPGGVGKTRLALAAAAGLGDSFPDGVCRVELAGLGCRSTVDDVADRILAALGLCDTVAAEACPADLVDWLCRATATRRVLLLLDNCEHLIDPVTELVGLLSAAAPEARVLVTSQETLDLPGEVVLAVPPLDLPSDEETPDPATAVRASAIELFVARAADAVPGFELNSENLAAVTTICRRLDGIPLALELLAPRLRVLAPEQLVGCLDDRFGLPEGSGRGRSTRQATLRGMIDWSWELLTEAEQIVLRRLSVLADGGTLEIAQVVCAAEDGPGDRVLDLLSRLVHRSLVVREGDRFRLLETVGAYAADRLAEAREQETVAARFVRAHVELAEAADRGLRGPDQRRGLDRLDVETLNLRRALETACRSGAADEALRLVNALAWYWVLRGRLSEARRSFRDALSVGGGDAAHAATARAWLTGVELRMSRPGSETIGRRRAGPPRAGGLFHGVAAVAAAECPPSDWPGSAESGSAELGDAELGDAAAAVADPALRARLRWFLGAALPADGRDQRGRRLLTLSLDGARAQRDRWTEAAVLVERAADRRTEDGAACARSDAERAAALFEDLGDRWGLLRALRTLASVAEEGGDRARSTRLHHAAVRMAEELGLWTEVVDTWSRLAEACLAGGDTAQAGRFYRRALRVAVERCHPRGRAEAEIGLARLARHEGDRDAVREHLRRAVADARSPELRAEIAAVAGDAGATEPLGLGCHVEDALADLPTAASLAADQTRPVAIGAGSGSPLGR
ncbi:putative ATPase/DNA-binding SARP family transcriptional activator [Actinoalloteichus hoggarensis]|uniref:Putative HTH-type transcriptional regulator n=1 Tax=Actinoalloteichus hoggarensis TaxID=1470176 RepID=A0A221W641_9PSEU|nr:BTAD domain-containing putative transcriptional regulator [Actinoalloteichus hoggarensis]ASO21153.1 Putative HTH-type transcriptional regulator [Actinoalloteichus hoggarensis]MBB5921082.1 putative ATPase/DNA-binding SARP family transcriptional activator [Actinoalloteichus hoggarensis]